MSDLQRRFAGLDRLEAPDLWDEIQLRAEAAPATQRVTVRRTTTPVPVPTRGRSFAVILAAGAVILALVAGAMSVGSWWPRPSSVVPSAPVATDPVATDPVSTDPVSTAPITWTGPLREEREAMVVHKMVARGDGFSALDAEDAVIGYVDISLVHLRPEGQAYWYLELAGWIPPRTDLNRNVTQLAYGLVVETTGDDVADRVIGLEDVPDSNDLRVWVTNLTTGETIENIGGPYGYPVEFALPVEGGQEPFDRPTVVFTFLGGTPNTIRFSAGTARFYAWASATVAGHVIARDYAPDTGWLSP